MSFLFVQNQPSTLSGSGAAAGDTTIVLTSFTEIDGETLLTMADFGTIGYGTIEPGNSAQEEQISFSGITQNANGTATLTGVKSVLMTSPYTETSGLSTTHVGGTQFVVSNTAGFYNQIGALSNDEEITGQWEAPPPVSADGIVTRDYMLSLINGGTISVNAVMESAIAGETIVDGNLVYFSETDNEWMKTDADTLATVFNVKLGIAQGDGVNGGTITGGVLTFGTYETSGLTPGDLLYASNTAGGFSSTVGTTPRVIGIAKSSTVMYFDPNFQNKLYDYAVDAVGTDAYAITLSGAFGAYYPGMQVTFKAGTANTGACTLAINGGTAKSIVKNVSEALITGDILANQAVTVVYDGTNFQVVSRLYGSNPVMRVYTSLSDTWTKPTGLKYVIAEVVGGGGGGGGTTTDGSFPGGGGGGGYSRKVIAVASLGATETVTIGNGGTAGAQTGGSGAAGGTSSFGVHLQATGGLGGTEGDATNLGGVGGSGGVGSGGDLNTEGSDGGGGGGDATTGGVGGYGGNSFYGGGGGSVGTTGDDSGNGLPGNLYGGGGSGAANSGGGDEPGGAGAKGIIIITEYYS